MAAAEVEIAREGEQEVGDRHPQGDPSEVVGGQREEEHAHQRRQQEEHRSAIPHDRALTSSDATKATAKAPGIVSTQAHTTRPATPHRTAESRRAAPTPTMAPVMVWVVETGMPPPTWRRASRQRPIPRPSPPRVETGDLRAHGLHDAPAAAQGAETHRHVGGQHDPQRDVGVGGQVVGRDQQGEDDAHRLLGVVGAVAEAEGGGRHQLSASEALVEDVEAPHPVEEPRDADRDDESHRQADEGR